MRITDLPELSAADLAENDVVAVDHDTGYGIETKKITWKNLLSKIYPVGSLYISAKATSPASLFGGTWEQIKDRFILAAGDTYAAGSTGGEAEHALTVDEMPAHRHEGINIDNMYCFGWENGSRTGVNFQKFYGGTYWGDDVQNRLASGYAGGSTAHNNMPPYLTAYIWKRIA
ncbi:phage baseplate protein [Faecalibacterium prausnitzii]|uniref:phage baseplate protein n=1 Tax=Faecalibacterium prausnitzii TaxID=853 RepID=UPI0026666FE0|nr:hypothetical protein [Faecalibacterium prausnitzii]